MKRTRFIAVCMSLLFALVFINTADAIQYRVDVSPIVEGLEFSSATTYRDPTILIVLCGTPEDPIEQVLGNSENLANFTPYPVNLGFQIDFETGSLFALSTGDLELAVLHDSALDELTPDALQGSDFQDFGAGSLFEMDLSSILAFKTGTQEIWLLDLLAYAGGLQPLSLMLKSLEIPAPDPVPEPSTFLLLGIGLAGMCAALRRKHGRA